MYTLPCDGPVEFRRAAREACREGVDVLKIVPSGDTSTPADARRPDADGRRRGGCRRRSGARSTATRVAAHARSAESVKMCVRHGVDVHLPRDAVPTRKRGTCSRRTRTASSWPRRFRSHGRGCTKSGKYGLPSSEAIRARIARDLDADGRMHEGPASAAACACCPAATTASCGIRTAATPATSRYFVDLLGFTPMEAIVGGDACGRRDHGLPDELGQVRDGLPRRPAARRRRPARRSRDAARIARGWSRS